MIKPWFVSYPRVIAASVLLCICAGVTLSLCLYDPMEPSVLYKASDVFPPSLGMYVANSIAAVFIHLCGWSGIALLVVMAVSAARLVELVHVSASSLVAAVALVVSNAMWCAHVNCELFPHVMAGGWLGMYLYRWLVSIAPDYPIGIILRSCLVVTGFATFKVRWIRYVMPYLRPVYYASVQAARSTWQHLRGNHTQIFPSLVQEHVARQEQEETTDESHIFFDAFWYTTRSQKSRAPHASEEHHISHASANNTTSSLDMSDEAEETLGAYGDGDLSDTGHEAGAYLYEDVSDNLGQSASYENTNDSVVHPEAQLLAEGSSLSNAPDEQAQQQARELEEKLATFGITGQVTDITCGPVVTIFSYQPDKAVKVANITAREDDLRLALQAVSLRIIAPVPGTSVVGFEVSRQQPQAVSLKQIITTSDFWSDEMALPLAIGCDTAGNPFVSDLARMPHVLVAGSTGSGKSVALHSFLVSLLYRCHPDEMKFVLIDPKRLEFAPYQQIPHRATPVITQPRSVVSTFEWLVNEMERRYDLLAQAGVRNITEYHQQYGTSELPYLVVVVDELADLMMGVGKDIEQYIARLAQMARAAGIHLIVATQRPSVDVVTGMIKVNFLSRIAFKVTSKIDSRTIVDQPGAEKLLGRGDMLHLDSRGALHRLHGGFITQPEIDAVIQHWAHQPYDHAFMFDPANKTQSDNESTEDELYHEVREFVQTCDTISISLIQRRFRIGYNRSARLVEALERDGVVSASDSNKMRKVLQ